MKPYAPFAVSLLVAVLAGLGAGCATDSGGRESEGGPLGRAGAGRRMARRDRQQPQVLWKQYDLNGDGKITREEFTAARAVCFARYDTNGDGMLTRAEVKKFFPPPLADRIDAAFLRLDLDRDGLISREEFDRESDRLFRQLDTNGDGVIAGNELSNITPAVLGDLCSETVDRLPGSPGRP
jgi:Ca2+-binding EF-hand superfamily protein